MIAGNDGDYLELDDDVPTPAENLGKDPDEFRGFIGPYQKKTPLPDIGGRYAAIAGEVLDLEDGA